jgi:site-specific recombinase XerD
MHVAAYIEQHPGSPQTIKQHLAAIKMLFDYLVISQIVPTNPAAPGKGPTHVVKRGKTPLLSVEDARTLLNSIPTDSLQGLRDRALIGVMLFSFARVSAVLGMKRVANITRYRCTTRPRITWPSIWKKRVLSRTSRSFKPSTRKHLPDGQCRGARLTG